jgi:hypothetical protein
MNEMNKLDKKSKLDVVMQVSILEVAGSLGLSSVMNRCTKCIYPEKITKGHGFLEFDIKDNKYKCPCMNETGDTIALVSKTKKITIDEAIEWLYDKFILKHQNNS